MGICYAQAATTQQINPDDPDAGAVYQYGHGPDWCVCLCMRMCVSMYAYVCVCALARVCVSGCAMCQVLCVCVCVCVLYMYRVDARCVRCVIFLHVIFSAILMRFFSEIFQLVIYGAAWEWCLNRLSISMHPH